MDKNNTVKSYGTFFDSVSLKLYCYALFCLKNEKKAEEAVEFAYINGYKSLITDNKQNMEDVLFKLASKFIISDDQSALKRCAVYLVIKLKMSLERVEIILSLPAFSVRKIF